MTKILIQPVDHVLHYCRGIRSLPTVSWCYYEQEEEEWVYMTKYGQKAFTKPTPFPGQYIPIPKHDWSELTHPPLPAMVRVRHMDASLNRSFWATSVRNSRVYGVKDNGRSDWLCILSVYIEPHPDNNYELENKLRRIRDEQYAKISRGQTGL